MASQRLVWRLNSCPMVKVEQRPPSTASLNSTFEKERFPSLSKQNTTTTSAASASADIIGQKTRKLPILLFDIMDTIVRDPFYHDVPAFFGMSMKELLESKHPTAWIEFEKGLINEMELAQIFFKDGRPIDLEGLKSCMRQGYSYIEGVEQLLIDLKKNGYEMHTATNYPIWKRKPDPDFYMDILKHLNIKPEFCVFIDDRMRNVEAARDAGFVGIQFKTLDSLLEDLSRLGIVIQTN